MVLAIGSGTRPVTMNADYKVFVSKDNRRLAALDALQNSYTNDDNILIALEPADGDVFYSSAGSDLPKRSGDGASHGLGRCVAHGRTAGRITARRGCSRRVALRAS